MQILVQKIKLYSLIILSAITFTVICSNTLYAQAAANTPQDTAQRQIPTIKAIFIVGDVYFAIQAFSTIEIKGSEVNPFLEVKNYFAQVGMALQSNNFQLTDTVNFDIPLPIANNAVYFLERATLTGSNAERYKRFVEAIIRASKLLKEQQKK